ncbi:MAG: DNA-binding protein WhiA [Erysipelotrichaceae bacterium]|nr:DNA-binding protein WhiA [Erysipelotrichaceae bacterium]
MSFASEVKEEVARLEVDDATRKGQLSAILKLLSSLNLSSSGLSLTVRSKNAVIIRKVAQDLQILYDVRPALEAVKENRFNKNNTYVINVEEKAREILGDLDLWTESGLSQHPSMKFLNSDKMVRAYLTGCFLATGSVNNPNKTNYHLEIVTSDESHARFIVRLLQKSQIYARIALRRSQYMIYIKASEQISDFLRLMQASNAVFTFEDVRIQRDFVNNLSRLNNCEIANEAKTLQAADKQFDAVSYLIESRNLEKLSAKDQEMALLRYENPEASLLELSKRYEERTGTILSKSGVRHRFNKIIELAEKYQRKEGQS